MPDVDQQAERKEQTMLAMNDVCSECGHIDSEHAYSDQHSHPDWMNDDGSVNYATHCHAAGCACSDWNGMGRPRAEGTYPRHG